MILQKIQEAREAIFKVVSSILNVVEVEYRNPKQLCYEEMTDECRRSVEKPIARK